MTEHEQGFHRLIAALYEAPLQSERWPEVWPQVAAFLAEICGDGDAGFLECRNLSRPDPTRPDPIDRMPLRTMARSIDSTTPA